MKKNIRFFIFNLLIIPATISVAGAATCSKASLTRCLDSACAVNIGANPAARCQQCGTSSAGVAKSTGLQNLSVGSSSANTLSASQLKSAPSDPGARYAWASAECIKKVQGCTENDISETYDPLIEQSCKAAGISAEMAALHSAAKKTKTSATCEADIKLCLANEKRCNSDFSGCQQNADFDKFFAACAIETGGCDNFTSALRTEMMYARDSAIKNKDTAIANVAQSHQTRRETTLKNAENSCKNNQARENCIKSVCATNMKNNCVPGFESEKSMATLLCKFHDTACDMLKK